MLKRLYDINKPEKKYFYFGSIFAILNGLIFPVSGLLLGEYVDVFSKPEASDFRKRADVLAILFVVLGVGA